MMKRIFSTLLLCSLAAFARNAGDPTETHLFVKAVIQEPRSKRSGVKYIPHLDHPELFLHGSRFRELHQKGIQGADRNADVPAVGRPFKKLEAFFQDIK